MLTHVLLVATLLLMFLSAGCAMLSIQVKKGVVAPGIPPLVDYRIVSPEAIEEECLRNNTPRTLLGCAGVIWVKLPGHAVPLGVARIIVTSQDPEIVAHELCHIVAKFNIKLGVIDEDPCHNEDKGLYMRRKPSPHPWDGPRPWNGWVR